MGPPPQFDDSLPVSSLSEWVDIFEASLIPSSLTGLAKASRLGRIQRRPSTNNKLGRPKSRSRYRRTLARPEIFKLILVPMLGIRVGGEYRCRCGVLSVNRDSVGFQLGVVFRTPTNAPHTPNRNGILAAHSYKVVFPFFRFSTQRFFASSESFRRPSSVNPPGLFAGLGAAERTTTAVFVV